jgi:hypothetical protein
MPKKELPQKGKKRSEKDFHARLRYGRAIKTSSGGNSWFK